MSSIFELDEQGYQQLAAQNRYEPATIDEIEEPDFAEGFLKGKEMGSMKGFARLGQAAGVLASPLVKAVGEKFDPSLMMQPDWMDPYYEALDENVNSAVDFWTPDARTVGSLGRVWGGLNETLVPLAAGAGNPTPLIATQQVGTSMDLVRQGVDAETAVEAGLLQSASAAAGFKVPIIGKTFGQRVFAGAGGNLGINVPTVFAQQQLLENRGYEELAKQYDPLDAEARTVDLLMGAAFGVLPADGPQLTPTQRAEVMTAADARHFQVDLAPGRPLDAEASLSHQRALEAGINALETGDPIQVPSAVTQSNFEARPMREPLDDAELKAFDAARVQATQPGTTQFKYQPDAGLSKADQAIEQSFGKQFAGDIRLAEARYNALDDTKGGKVLSVDTARELSPDYLKDRTRSAAVHEPASAFIKQLYAQKLAEAPKPGELPLVLFTAGGTGAGKTTAINTALGNAANVAQIVYDTNLSGRSGAIQKIDQALAAGKNVQIAYTYRDPIDALRQGALSRAMRQEKEFGSGRTVPVTAHLDTHIGARQTVEEIAAHYADDQRVQVLVIDNSLGHGKSKLVELGSIPKFDERAYNSLREQALHVIDEEHAAGRISDSVRRGFTDDVRADQGDVPARAQQGDRSGARGQPEQERSQTVRFEPTSDAPPAPGTNFLVARFAKNGALENSNAGNTQAISDFLARLDDHERVQPVGSEQSDTLFVYRATAPEKFGAYEHGSRGKQMKGEAIGRRVQKDGISYSFPKGTEPAPLIAIPIAEVRAELKAITGTESFDDLGSIKGGEALAAILERRTAEVLAEKPKEAATPEDQADAAKSYDSAAKKFGLQTPQAPLAVQAVKELLAARDIQVATGLIDEDGNAITRSGREVMAEAEAAIAKAENDAKAFDAAVSCFLTNGVTDAA